MSEAPLHSEAGLQGCVAATAPAGQTVPRLGRTGAGCFAAAVAATAMAAAATAAAAMASRVGAWGGVVGCAALLVGTWLGAMCRARGPGLTRPFSGLWTVSACRRGCGRSRGRQASVGSCWEAGL